MAKIRRRVSNCFLGLLVVLVLWQGWVFRSQALASRALGLERAHRQLMLDAAPVGVVVVGGDLKVSYVNEAALEVFGRGRGELVGLSPSVLVAEEFRGAHELRMLAARAALEGAPFGWQFTSCGISSEVSRPDGSVVEVMVSIRGFHLEDGSVEFMAFIAPRGLRAHLEPIPAPVLEKVAPILRELKS